MLGEGGGGVVQFKLRWCSKSVLQCSSMRMKRRESNSVEKVQTIAVLLYVIIIIGRRDDEGYSRI